MLTPVVAVGVLATPSMASAGEEFPPDAQELTDRVVTLWQEGKYAEGLPIAQEQLRMLEGRFGPQHAFVAEPLTLMGFLFVGMKKFDDARTVLERALGILERARGSDHEDLLNTLEALGSTYLPLGDAAAAERVMKRRLTIAQRRKGQDSDPALSAGLALGELYLKTNRAAQGKSMLEDIVARTDRLYADKPIARANVAGNVAAAYQAGMSFAEAEAYYVRQLKLIGEIIGPESAEAFSVNHSVAEMLFDAGMPARALPYAERTLELSRKVDVGQFAEPTVMRLVGECQMAMGRNEEALATFRAEQRIWEERAGARNYLVAYALSNQGQALVHLGDGKRAIPVLQEALAMFIEVEGTNHHRIGTVNNSLGASYELLGDYYQAIVHFEKAVEVWKQTLGEKDAKVGIALLNIGKMHAQRGEVVEAHSHYMQALELIRSTQGPGHKNVAEVLESLARLAQSVGKLDDALDLASQALEVRRGAFGVDHPAVARNLDYIGHIHQRRREFDQARARYEESAAILRKKLPEDAEAFVDVHNNLGSVSFAQRRYDEALTHYRRSVELAERHSGADSPALLNLLNNLSALLQMRGELDEAISVQARAAEIAEKKLLLVFASGSEEARRLHVENLMGDTFGTMSLHTVSAAENKRARDLALLTVLRRKGRVLDAVSDDIASLRARVDDTDRAILEEYVALRSRIAAVTLRGPVDRTPEEHRELLRRLALEMERVEQEVSKRGVTARGSEVEITLSSVALQIPPNAALVEYFAYLPFQGNRGDDSTSGTSWGAKRYVAYVMTREGTAGWADLGEAAPIDEAVTQLRKALSTKADDFEAKARALDEKVLAPLRPLFETKQQLLLSPDAALNLVPFAALVGPDGKYVVQKHDVSYLSSGRDLLRLGRGSKGRQGPVVVGAPDFEQADDADADAGGDGTRSAALLRTARFPPLPGTADEVKRLNKMLPDTTLRTGVDASESFVKGVRGPVVLHVATHGFFLEDANIPPPAGGRGLELSEGTGPAPAPSPDALSDPLLRSGLALAGANRRESSGEDGILSALEVAGLDLWGTQMVVLSACETGLGQVQTGEGVYGLRRALVIAGAESQVMSLWSVSDEATRDLMLDFYKQLERGKGRGEALRAAQLKMLGKRKYQHPFYWAAFIPSGDWMPMSFEHDELAPEPELERRHRRARRPRGGGLRGGSGAVRDYWRNPPSEKLLYLGGDYSAPIRLSDYQGFSVEQPLGMNIDLSILVHPRVQMRFNYGRARWEIDDATATELVVNRMEFDLMVDLLALPWEWRIRPALMPYVGTGPGIAKITQGGGASLVAETTERKLGWGVVVGGEGSLYIRFTRKFDIQLRGGVAKPIYAFGRDSLPSDKGFPRDWHWTVGGALGFAIR